VNYLEIEQIHSFPGNNTSPYPVKLHLKSLFASRKCRKATGF